MQAASRGFWGGSWVPCGYATVMIQDGAKRGQMNGEAYA